MSNTKVKLEKVIEELKVFKFISENSSDAHFLLGRDAKFLYVNKGTTFKIYFPLIKEVERTDK